MAVEPALHTLSFVVTSEHDGQRLDQFLRQKAPSVSRAALREHFAAGAVRVAGRPVRKAVRLQVGDHVTLSLPSTDVGPGVDDTLALHVIYEDRCLVAVDKPAHVPSHALRPGELGTVVSALLARYPELRSVGYRPLEPGLLHRLDNETSGILVAARDTATFERLRAQHEAGAFQKQYLALVHGQLQPQHVTSFLKADKRSVTVRREPFAGAASVSLEIVTSEPYTEHSLVCVQLTRAARHQVRAQLAQLGHPISGDAQYGGSALPGLTRHFLHASALTLPHPESGQPLTLRAELPEDLRAVLAQLRLTDRTP